jgi:hypothetical protein
VRPGLRWGITAAVWAAYAVHVDLRPALVVMGMLWCALFWWLADRRWRRRGYY